MALADPGRRPVLQLLLIGVPLDRRADSDDPCLHPRAAAGGAVLYGIVVFAACSAGTVGEVPDALSLGGRCWCGGRVLAIRIATQAAPAPSCRTARHADCIPTITRPVAD